MSLLSDEARKYPFLQDRLFQQFLFDMDAYLTQVTLLNVLTTWLNKVNTQPTRPMVSFPNIDVIKMQGDAIVMMMKSGERRAYQSFVEFMRKSKVDFKISNVDEYLETRQTPQSVCRLFPVEAKDRDPPVHPVRCQILLVLDIDPERAKRDVEKICGLHWDNQEEMLQARQRLDKSPVDIIVPSSGLPTF